MIQEQLVDYISSQMKLGVSREAIKSALVSAGWVAGDIEDTLKKIEGGGSASSPTMAKPAQSMSMANPSAMSKPAGSATPASQTIRVSDLVSGSSPAGPAKPAEKMEANKFEGKIMGNTFQATSPSSTSSSMPKKSMGSLIMKIVGGIVILGLAGLAWYFYAENSSLAAQVTALNSQSASVSSQLASLQTAMDASSTSMTAEVSSLTAANADLALNLSFYAAPLDATATTTPVTISGSLSAAGKTGYMITTPRGAKIVIANAATASIASQLKPFVGQTVTIMGAYLPGSDQITMSSITGPPGTPAPAPAAATSTPAATAPTPAATSTATQ